MVVADSHAAALLKQGSIPPTTGAQLSLPKVGSVPREIVREGSHADVSKVRMGESMMEWKGEGGEGRQTDERG